MATELGTAYVSIVAETSKLEAGIKAALDGGGKQADLAGQDIGKRISASASKAMKDGWRPDQDIMAGIPDTKLDRIGARIGQVIGKGMVGGMRAREAGVQFGHSFAQGAGSVGLGGVISRWRQELGGGGALNAIGMMAGKSLSLGLTAAIGAGVAGAGLALTKGFDRLLTIDSAKYKLKGLGKSTQEIADIVKTVTESVTGTPFALDQAFGTATQAIGSGVKDIKRFMTDVADAAGFAGVGIDRMGLIFNQVQAKGKLTGEEMMQLMEAGLPAKSWITESYNLTSDEFDKMQQKGEISMQMLQQSIENHAAGMAKGLGNTLQGSIDQMQTSIARIGADFLSAVFGGASGDPAEGMKDAINRITEMLNKLDEWIKAHRDDIRQFFTSAADAAKGLFSVLGDILGYLKEHPGAIQAVVTAFVAWEGIKGIAAVAGAISTLNVALGSTAGLATAAYGPLAAIGAIIAGGVIGGASLSDAINANGPNSEAGQNAKNQATAPGMGVPGASRDPIFQPSGPNIPGGGGSNAQRERRGLPPIDPTGGLLSSGIGGGGNSFTGANSPEAWRPAVRNAIAQYGGQLGITNSKAWEDALVRQIATESGGNPRADNPNDSNGQGGKQHVTGLLQFLPSTFASHNISGGGYTDPNAQIAAALDYVTKRYGMDKNGAPFQIGRGVGYDSGGWLKPGVTQAVNNTGQPEAVFTQSQLQDMRTSGAIPAAAGSTAQAGSSTISSFIDMGGEVINGIIDQAASAASSAAGAAAIAGSFGAAGPEGGAAASAATQAAIGMGTSAAKRGVTYGFDIAGILADSVMQQLSPFGQPRWLNQDFTGFVPQQQITGALGNLMSGGAQQASNPTGSLLDPKTKEHGTGMGAAPGPIDQMMGNLGPQSPDPMISDANSFLSTQLATPEAPPPGQQPIFKVDNIYTQDVDSLGRELNKQGRLAQMQYTNRPGP